MLECLQYLHEFKYLHRDVKPDNFRIKDNKVKIIDLGSARTYIAPNGQHIPDQATTKVISGNPLFASANAHLGKEPSRRDDLESLGYTMLFLLTNDLPWYDGDVDLLNKNN
jgi:serine/threonine protein kinase